MTLHWRRGEARSILFPRLNFALFPNPFDFPGQSLFFKWIHYDIMIFTYLLDLPVALALRFGEVSLVEVARLFQQILNYIPPRRFESGINITFILPEIIL